MLAWATPIIVPEAEMSVLPEVDGLPAVVESPKMSDEKALEIAQERRRLMVQVVNIDPGMALALSFSGLPFADFSISITFDACFASFVN